MWALPWGVLEFGNPQAEKEAATLECRDLSPLW